MGAGGRGLRQRSPQRARSLPRLPGTELDPPYCVPTSTGTDDHQELGYNGELNPGGAARPGPEQDPEALPERSHDYPGEQAPNSPRPHTRQRPCLGHATGPPSIVTTALRRRCRAPHNQVRLNHYLTRVLPAKPFEGQKHRLFSLGVGVLRNGGELNLRAAGES